MDRRAWWVTVYGVANSQTRLNDSHALVEHLTWACVFVVSWFSCETSHLRSIWECSVATPLLVSLPCRVSMEPSWGSREAEKP